MIWYERFISQRGTMWIGHVVNWEGTPPHTLTSQVNSSYEFVVIPVSCVLLVLDGDVRLFEYFHCISWHESRFGIAQWQTTKEEINNFNDTLVELARQMPLHDSHGGVQTQTT